MTDHGLVRIFCSYSAADEKLFRHLEEHLSPLKRSGMVFIWSNRQIQPGADWMAETVRELEAADLILLLVSSSFLNSDFCHDVELSGALEKAERREAIVIPVLLKPCEWNRTVLQNFRCLPRNERPIRKWRLPDEGLLEVAKGIRETVENIRRTKKQKHQGTASTARADAELGPSTETAPFEATPPIADRDEVLEYRTSKDLTAPTKDADDILADPTLTDGEPESHPDINAEIVVEYLLDELGWKLMGSAGLVISQMDETNATGWYMDQYEIHNVEHDPRSDRLSFRATLHFSGDQLEGRMWYGDAITVELSGNAQYHEGEWSLDDYQIEHCWTNTYMDDVPC
jgi:hypothetical protein